MLQSPRSEQSRGAYLETIKRILLQFVIWGQCMVWGDDEDEPPAREHSNHKHRVEMQAVAAEGLNLTLT